MRVLLIDDHPLILAALQTVIQGLGEDVQVLGADSAAQARDTLKARQDFDLVLLDLNLGDASGFDVLEEFRSQYPALPVVVISASDRASDVIRAIDQGAMGFIPKRTGNDVLAQALKLVMSGGIYVPPMSLGSDSAPEPEPVAVAESAAHGNSRLHQVQALASQAGYQTTAGLESLQLTPRQTDVLALLLQGKPNKIIARELGVSVETIKDHVAAVLKALGVSSRTQAVLAVGLTTPPNARQEAFEANYGDRYTRWGWKRIQHRLVQRMLKEFGGREKEGIHLVPTQLYLDPIDGYPANNGVHPNAEGYAQIGTSFYCWLKSVEWGAGTTKSTK